MYVFRTVRLGLGKGLLQQEQRLLVNWKNPRLMLTMFRKEQQRQDDLFGIAFGLLSKQGLLQRLHIPSADSLTGPCAINPDIFPTCTSAIRQSNLFLAQAVRDALTSCLRPWDSTTASSMPEEQELR